MTVSFAWADFGSALALLVIGALLTSLLIPFVTLQWQNQQKALETKVSLLDRMSDATARIITHAWFRELGHKDKLEPYDREEFDWRYGEWEVEVQVLLAELKAYFSGSPEIAAVWFEHCNLLRELHRLSWVKHGRDEILRTLEAAYASETLFTVTGRRRSGLRRVLRLRPQERTFSTMRAAVPWEAFTNTDHHDEYMGSAFRQLADAMRLPSVALGEAVLYADVATL